MQSVEIAILNKSSQSLLHILTSSQYTISKSLLSQNTSTFVLDAPNNDYEELKSIYIPENGIIVVYDTVNSRYDDQMLDEVLYLGIIQSYINGVITAQYFYEIFDYDSVAVNTGRQPLRTYWRFISSEVTGNSNLPSAIVDMTEVNNNQFMITKFWPGAQGSDTSDYLLSSELVEIFNLLDLLHYGFLNKAMYFAPFVTGRTTVNSRYSDFTIYLKWGVSSDTILNIDTSDPRVLDYDIYGTSSKYNEISAITYVRDDDDGSNIYTYPTYYRTVTGTVTVVAPGGTIPWAIIEQPVKKSIQTYEKDETNESALQLALAQSDLLTKSSDLEITLTMAVDVENGWSFGDILLGRGVTIRDGLSEYSNIRISSIEIDSTKSQVTIVCGSRESRVVVKK